MKIILILFLFNALIQLSSNDDSDDVPIEDRINFLKFQIYEQNIRAKNKNKEAKDKLTFINDNLESAGFKHLENEELEYIVDNEPITPIMDYDDRKKNHKFLLPRLKTTELPRHHQLENKKKRRQDERRSEFRNNSKIGDPVIDIYRKKNDENIYYLNTPMKWVHCTDLITPILSGYTNECKPPKLLELNHHLVQRIFHLLKINTTNYVKHDIYSLLYQISNLQIRLFQFNLQPMRSLFNFLCRGEKHTFQTLKHGIKDLFRKWHLDFTNVTNLLKQSRVFRPYCITYGQHGGSTRTSPNTRYVSKTTRTKKLHKDLSSDSD